ncbi:MAG TPA: hypothetical protein VFE96_07845 [Candidatus Bathyarchaeia archaeon]|nr:hypothetical protein [Candidatus Bathyarchaeia archaeon]
MNVPVIPHAEHLGYGGVIGEMETRHLRTRWAASGYGSALVAFVVSAFFFVDVFGEYFVNTSYFFALGWWYEFTIATVTAAAGAILAFVTYFRRK